MRKKAKCATLIGCLLLATSCNENDLIEMDGELMAELESSAINSSFVSESKAGETANLFMKKLSDKASTRSYNDFASVKTISKNGAPLMYVFNYKDGGFVIISATKDYYPILAYSEESNFDASLGISGVMSWIEDTKESVSSSETLNDSIKAKIQGLWESLDIQDYPVTRETSSTRVGLGNAEIACYERCEDLLNQYGYGGDQGWHFWPLAEARQALADIGYSWLYDNLCYSAEFNQSTPSTSVLGWKFCTEKDEIGPLVQTSWHQSSPYNDYCNGHAAGCGPIALAQLMNYYKYPSQFTYNGHTYNWNNYQVAALVKYVYDKTSSSPIGDSSYTTPGEMEDGIKKIGYSVSVEDNVPYKVEQEVMSGHRPVIMLGNSTNVSFLPGSLAYIGDSHYWICDGMKRTTQGKLYIFTEWQPNGNGNFVSGWGTIDNPDTYGGVVYTYSHMNWGWGGKCDGWFSNTTKPSGAYQYDHPNMSNSSNYNFKYARKNFYIRKN